MNRNTEWREIEAQLLNGLDDIFVMILNLGQDGDAKNNAWSGFVSECRARYEAGRSEHENSNSTWDEWDDAKFEHNIHEELMDAVIYAAARTTRTLKGTT